MYHLALATNAPRKFITPQKLNVSPAMAPNHGVRRLHMRDDCFWDRTLRRPIKEGGAEKPTERRAKKGRRSSRRLRLGGVGVFGGEELAGNVSL